MMISKVDLIFHIHKKGKIFHNSLGSPKNPESDQRVWPRYLGDIRAIGTLNLINHATYD